MKITKERLHAIIVEEITKSDRSEIERMIKKELKAMVEDEVAKAIKSKDIKDDIGDISKKILKKLYKDMSVHHPYIIDRIKV
jgi:LEA14-like dessication related protein|tara:strand:+ start:571 stop:816 length:246 start_codon:yes stop_codon:yes gene_type:complete